MVKSTVFFTACVFTLVLVVVGVRADDTNSTNDTNDGESSSTSSSSCQPLPLTSAPQELFDTFAAYPDDFPILTPVEGPDDFQAQYMIGRYYTAETSMATASITFQCDCPILDTGFTPSSSSSTTKNNNQYFSQVAMYPRSPPETVMITFLSLPYTWLDDEYPYGNVFDDLHGSVYTNMIVKVGPIVDEGDAGKGYAYYVNAVTYAPWLGDDAPEGLTLPNQGVFSFEVYVRNVQDYYDLYQSDVHDFINSTIAGLPDDVIDVLTLEEQNQTDCKYPYLPPYFDESAQEAAAQTESVNDGDKDNSSSSRSRNSPFSLSSSVVIAGFSVLISAMLPYILD